MGALADFMITFRNTSVVTLIAKILYPFMGFAKPLPKEEVDTLVQKWKTEIWPSVTKMIGYSGGPFVGGSVPNIGELACFGYLNGLLLAKEDHPIFTSGLRRTFLQCASISPATRSCGLETFSRNFTRRSEKSYGWTCKITILYFPWVSG